MQILIFIAGLGILLFAMKQLEESLARLGEGALRRSLQEFTRTPLHGILLGTITTAILQSSSIVGLMTMAFVGASVLPLRNAIGVILGCNLGTTFTGWLVTWLGFKIDLTDFYVLLIGGGALLTLGARQEGGIRSAGAFLVAFGLLLFGLVLMQDSITFVLDYVDVASLRDVPAPVYFVFGMLLTALIQSSSVTMMISLSAISTGILGMPAAAAIMVGANLGTTSTLLLGAIKGPTVKRQIALVHVLFNLVVSLLALVLLPGLLFLVRELYALDDPLYGLVSLYTTINLAGILLFLPFVGVLQRRVESWLPIPRRQALLIEQVGTEVPEAALKAVEQDVATLIRGSVQLNAWRMGLLENLGLSAHALPAETPQTLYADLKGYENQLSAFLLDLQRVPLSPEQVQRVQSLLVCIRDCVYSTKAVKDAEADVVRFRLESGISVKDVITRLLDNMQVQYARVLRMLAGGAAPGKTDFDDMREALRQSHAGSNVAIYRLIEQKGLRHDRASSALNINRELLLASHSLVNALEHLLLPRDDPRTVSQWLNQVPPT